MFAWYKNMKTGTIWKVDVDTPHEKRLSRDPDFKRLSKKQLDEEKKRLQNKELVIDEYEDEEKETGEVE